MTREHHNIIGQFLLHKRDIQDKLDATAHYKK